VILLLLIGVIVEEYGNALYGTEGTKVPADKGLSIAIPILTPY
jgi:hypothetical protein